MVDERQFADFLFHHQPVSRFNVGGWRGGDQLAGHHIVDLRRGVGREFDVGGGQDADQIVLFIKNRKTAEIIALFLAGVPDIGKGLTHAKGHRGRNHAVQIMFHRADDRGLTLGSQVFVDHADAAVQGHRDRHAGLGHRVHRRADKRDVHRDARRQFAGDFRVGRKEICITRHQ